MYMIYKRINRHVINYYTLHKRYFEQNKYKLMINKILINQIEVIICFNDVYLYSMHTRCTILYERLFVFVVRRCLKSPSFEYYDFPRVSLWSSYTFNRFNYHNTPIYMRLQSILMHVIIILHTCYHIL